MTSLCQDYKLLRHNKNQTILKLKLTKKKKKNTAHISNKRIGEGDFIQNYSVLYSKNRCFIKEVNLRTASNENSG